VIWKSVWRRVGMHFLGMTFLPVCLAGVAGAQAGGALFGPAGVTPQAVRQGSLGSCYFHASIAALAKAAPDTLRGAISGDGKVGYRVHFFSGPDELVETEDVEFARAQGFDHSDGLWVTVLMRAYAQRQLRESMVRVIEQSELLPIFAKPVVLAALAQTGPLVLAYDRAIRSVISQGGTGSLDKTAFKKQLTKQLSAAGIPSMQAQWLLGFLDQAGFYDTLAQTVQANGEIFGAYRGFGQGGIPVSVLEAFVGKASQGEVSEGNAPAIEAVLIRLHREGLAMVAGTRAALPLAAADSAGPSSKSTPDWWVGMHAYTVMDYNQGTGAVTLRNPWGGKPAPDGAFTLPLVSFLQAYKSYAYPGPAEP